MQTAKGERRSSPPAILLAIARAKDRRGAVERLCPQGTLALTAYDPEALAERGEFVHRSFVVGKDYGEALEDLSE